MTERSWWIRAAIVLVACSAAVYLFMALGRFWAFMGDLVLILFFAWLLGSLLILAVNALMRVPYMRRPVAIVLVYVALIVLVAILVLFIIPSAVDQTVDLFDRAPEYVERIPVWLTAVDDFALGFGVQLDLANRYQLGSTENILTTATSWATDNAGLIFQSVVSTLFAVGLIIALSFYVVLDGGRRVNEALTVLPPNVEREVRLVTTTFNRAFHGYIRGMFFVSAIYGIGVAAVMYGTGLPAALPSAILASLLLAVPFIGDWLALGLPLLIAIAAGDFATVVIVLGTLLFIQQVMLNLLTPRILGQAVQMPAGLVIVSVVIGARLIGIPGALLGVPAGAFIYSLAVVYGNRVKSRRAAATQASAAESVWTPPPDDEASRTGRAGPGTSDAVGGAYPISPQQRRARGERPPTEE
ncbi:MAG: AI-2E family transporter [Dehalococcoidia bacterium]|nr:AI-2E family transporter [Dehalococcoidia bacterium]